ncbi:uncharacterized protein METZ01_LOCUS99096, partial [marine metagenome]
MIKSIHIVLAGALLMCSFAFALDKPIKAKSSQNTMLVKKDVKIDKKAVGKNPRLEKAEQLASQKQNRVQYLMPGGRSITNAKAIERFGPDAFDVNDLDVIPLPKKDRRKTHKEDLSRDELWNLSYVNEGDAYYYLGSGAANDTFATVFTPAAPCRVKEVYYQWFSAGNCIAFGADYGDADLISSDGNCYDIARGDAYHVDENGDTTHLSPIGAPRTTATPNTIAGYVSDWSSDAFLDIGGEFVVGDSTDLSAVDQFAIVAIKGGDTPQPLACNNDALGRTETYTWFGGPWTDGLWGRYHYITDNMVLVKVTYPWGAPIAVASMTQPSNTYNTAATIAIDVDLFDDEDDAGTAIDENDTLTYYYIAGGVENTGSLMASEVAANGNGIYTFDITYDLAAGDSVMYWVDLVDNDGLTSGSAMQYFHVVAPLSPASDVLLVVDNIDVDQETVLYDAMDLTGFVYEVWDVQINKGIDASVINHGWSNIIVSGWGVSSVPATDQDDPGYETYVDAGNNLVVMDMDLFFGHGLDAEITFAEGDFMYDVFGISAGVNDPMNDAGDASLHGDTLTVYGAGETSLDSPFTDGYDMNHTILMTAGWTDLVEAGDATGIFLDDDDSEVGATMAHANGGTATYLAFMPESGVDWYIVDGDTMGWDITQVEDFTNALLGYLGAVSPPQVSVDGPSSTRFGVASGITTATINGSAADGDGTLTSVNAVYDIDGTENTTAMTDNGDGTFSATIDLTAWTDTSSCTYWLSATDNDGLTQTSGFGYFWGTSHDPSGADVLLMSDHYVPYWVYGPGDADSIVNVNMASLGVAYDTWSVWDNYQPDPGSVLSQYDAVVYHAVYDWVLNPTETDVHPLGEFVASSPSNFLLYSSEEVIGTYTDWEDISIPAGHFVHDVLGVEWAMNDIGYDTVNVLDDVAVTADMTTDDIPLNAALDYFGSMADIVDPLYWGTDDQLPSPFESSDGAVTALGVPSYYVSTENANVVFMAFNLSMMPDDAQQAVLGNFLAWSGSTTSNEDELNLPTQFALYENYPNPFNPVTTIRFDVPEVSDVNITVYNLLGKQVN